MTEPRHLDSPRPDTYRQTSIQYYELLSMLVLNDCFNCVTCTYIGCEVVEVVCALKHPENQVQAPFICLRQDEGAATSLSSCTVRSLGRRRVCSQHSTANTHRLRYAPPLTPSRARMHASTQTGTQSCRPPHTQSQFSAACMRVCGALTLPAPPFTPPPPHTLPHTIEYPPIAYLPTRCNLCLPAWLAACL